MSLLEVKQLTHSYGDKKLYSNAGFELYKGEHMGVVGANGTGKSTLLKIICKTVIPDEGIIKWQSNINIGILDQYAVIAQGYNIYDYLKTAFNELYRIEEKLNDIYEKMAYASDEKLMKKASVYQDILEKGEFYSIDSNIKKVATGLGIDALGYDNKLNELSGGQRAKVILAKLLLQNPDILLLDEPTNFLDKEHVQWLSEYLRGFKGAFMIISHDLDFLEAITTCICDIDHKDIRKYNCGYSQFLIQKERIQDDYTRKYVEQQRQIKKLEKYIAKNKVRASTAKIARGRQKQLDKIERMESLSFNIIKPIIKFKYKQSSVKKALTVENLQVGYKFPILPKINFTIKNGEKVVVTGFNGIGKSTLLKTIVGEIRKLSGSVKFGDNIVPGYYEQDLKWENSDMTPIEIISDKFPKMTQREIRKHLSQCGVKSETAVEKIKSLSGGEQSKVKLCRLTFMSCNLLILDEITNHMDMNSKEALKDALINYEGTIILVSHEASFYNEWADRIINIEKLI